jgi:predicted helicase
MPDQREALRGIHTFPQLIKFLRDDLDWPIESDDFEELTFDYTPEELGIDTASAAKIQEIKRLRPLSAGQPWGIFFVKFEPKRLPVLALRRVLSRVVLKKRASANSAERAAWQADDLLFISNYGQGDERQISFAHFSTHEEKGDLPTLMVLGWDSGDTALHLDDVADKLTTRLSWPQRNEDAEHWRERWRSAFTLRHREVVTTSKALAERLADLAKSIRKRVNAVLKIESDKGDLRKLHVGFREILIHDLSEDDFADMYAQTIAYGLLTARVSRPSGLVAENLRDMVPVTNPFLKDLLDSFLAAGGRKGKVDFDELGVSEVVQLLRDADMEAVLRDFGDRNPEEDPAIHFYELFLKEYDPKKRMQRGVFYTPRPVVSYIVRSVHELLQTEFGLEQGLASTATWGEMAQRVKGLTIPDGVALDSAFVQILDPATGTATFLVEVIDVIHRTLAAQWKQRRLTEAQQRSEWNEYVPKHLLARLHGYELMMAPYAIAHMKIGLKLYETGYRFGSDERVRVYLTNALEPPNDDKKQREFEDWAPALAHEAQAVNAVKRRKRFTVVVGNPPYSKISSNLTSEMRAIIERYRYVNGERIRERGALQFEINLQDDYVKFFRLCEEAVDASSRGVLGLITNNGYLSTPTLRGMRDSLLESFRTIWIIDLHGHLSKGELGPDGVQEENVFDILQGVSLFLGSRVLPRTGDATVFHADRYGSRLGKYQFLQANSQALTGFSNIHPSPPFYLFIPHDADLSQEWTGWVGLADLFPRNSAGIITARDGLVIAENKQELAKRLEEFSQARGNEASIYTEFGFSESKRFDLRQAQSELRKLKSFSEPIRRMLHRPFDRRFVFFHPSVVWSLSRPMAAQMVGGDNLALVATRQVTRPQFEHAFVSRDIIEIKACSHDRNTQIFPLFLRQDGELAFGSETTANLNQKVGAEMALHLGLKWQGGARELGKEDELTPQRLFGYAYAILNCPSYRLRYFEFLRSDFARLPLSASRQLFGSLAKLGGELVALHLLESSTLDKLENKYTGPTNPEVEKISYARDTVWLDKAQSRGFRGVSEAVWDFHIGGYQVCEKWLKDRKGRTLSKNDISHYHKIVVALSETIRLMTEIDNVIEKDGGWPGAFITPKS